MSPEQRMSLIQHLAVERLRAVRNGWRVEQGVVIGPGTTGLAFADHDGLSDRHVDIGFVLNRDRPDSPIIWDCAVGYGRDLESALTHALDVWMACTAPVVLELLCQTGEHATHMQPGDHDGLTGWHCIHGGVMGFGDATGAKVMQSWVLDHPLLPALGEQLSRQLDHPQLNGIKFLFGSDVAEVRINGHANDAASEALANLTWPRLNPPAFARCFVLAVHPA